MTSSPALEVFAEFASRPSLPREVRSKAKTCLVDALWGCLQIHEDDRAQAALRCIATDGPGARSPILYTPHLAHAADAAFVTAIACAATDRSDTYVSSATHPGIIVIPAVLAACAASEVTGEDLLWGIVVGYETMARIARAVHSPALARIFRPTAISAPVAAALATAAALRLPPEQITAAGALAAQTATGFNEWAHAGTGEHVFHAGVAARNAVTSALLAREGCTAAPSSLDGPSGVLAAHNARDKAPELTRDLGGRFEILEIVFKPAPACFFAQTPVQLAAEIGAMLPDPANIATIDIAVTQAAFDYPGCRETQSVGTIQAATMSIAFGVATTLLAGRIDPLAWQHLHNPAANALMQRCTIAPDADLSSAFPARCGARIAVHLKDGSSKSLTQGDFRSMTPTEVLARFHQDAVPLIGSDATAGLLAWAHQCDRDQAPIETLRRAASLAAVALSA